MNRHSLDWNPNQTQKANGMSGIQAATSLYSTQRKNGKKMIDHKKVTDVDYGSLFPTLNHHHLFLLLHLLLLLDSIHTLISVHQRTQLHLQSTCIL